MPLGAHRTAPGATPSFDCGHATSPAEQLICADDGLAALDQQLGTVFRDSREGRDDAARSALLLDQRHWLQARLVACNIPAKGEMPADQKPAATHCLSDQYTARIAALKPVAVAAPATQAAAVIAPAPDSSPPIAKPASANVAAPTSSGSAKLDKTLFPAMGNSETLATITDFGRYAISVKSDQGTALQLVDRMAGPSAVDGSAGHSDGRIDAFLDRGQYKIKLLADARGSGDAELSIAPFAELNPAPMQLVELKPLAADLGDHEQRSYWLDIKQRRFVAIEAAGRYLADMRLWKDGNWLVDATPTSGGRDPTGGEPLAIRQLALWLEPGLYRLTAYGGVGEKWASGSNAKPFYLRYGIPTLPDAGRFVEEASPFGVDRWLVPKSSTYFRLEIDRSEHAALSVATYEQSRPYATGGDRATVEKDSRDPVAEVSVGGGSPEGYWLVTVERTPGAKYRLQYFDDTRERRLAFDGKRASYWLATLQAGSGEDTLDPTVIVVRDGREVVAASTVQIDPAKAWHRKFNLIQPVSLFLHADQPVDLAVEGTGADAEYKIEPAWIGRPDDFKSPPTKTSGGVWQVDKGYWILTVAPREGGKGILSMTLRPAKAAPEQPSPPESPRLAAPVFPNLSFDANHPYMAYLNATGGTFGGAAVQNLPFDLRNGTSFQLVGGAEITMPATLPVAGRLDGHTEDGTAVPLAIDAQAPAATQTVTAGKHMIALTAPGDKPVYISLIFTPATQLDTAPLPPVDPARLAQRPQFPALLPGKPAFLDLAHEEHATYAVAVDKPALYRLESSGIIETGGEIRTRTVTSLDDAASNGSGRNFLLQQYLREGDYQLTVRAAGQSFGAIGLSVEATQVADLGALEPELWARATLAPGQAGRYRFHIAEAGGYELHTIGLHHDFKMRLDDGDGWPMIQPGSDADVTMQFAIGDYEMVLLPGSLESRAVTLLHRNIKPVELSGHGPFALALQAPGRNRWMEPEKGAARAPDRWTFTLPAEAETTIAVDNGMKATLVQDGKKTDKVALSERAWTGTLPMGDYAVEVVSAAPNSRVDYALTVTTTEMLVGERRTVDTPVKLPVSIGADKQIEFASFGGEDVKARLFDGAGKLVAANDDRENDWNFLIPLRLAPGRYQLQVDPVGAKALTTEVALTQAEEVQDPRLAFGQSATIEDDKVHIVPLGDSQPGALIAVTTHSGTQVGLSIEGQEADKSWHMLGSTSGRDPFLAFPRGASASRPLRVRVWSVDHGHIPIYFAVSAVMPATGSESSLGGRGITLAPLDGAASSLAAVAVTLDQPGVLKLGAGGDTVLWATAGETTAARDSSGSIVAPSTKIWLVDRADPKHPATVAARRIDPNGADPVHLVVKGGDSITLPISANAKDGFALWRVDGQSGQPGIALREMGAMGARPPLMAAGADSPTQGSAVAIAPIALTKPVIKIWNADASSDEMPVILSRVPFGAPKAVTVQPGIADGAFTGREAQALALPPGVKRLTLVLPPDTVAVPMKGDVPEQMIWAVSSRAEIVETAAERLLLLHAATEAAPFSLAVEPLDAKVPLILSSGAIISRYTPIPGLLHFVIDPAPAGETMLHVTGSAKMATVISPDGMVSHGADVSVSPGSLVSVGYEPGLLAVGLDAPATPASAAPSIAVALPSAVALAGAHMSLSIAGGAPRLIHLASDTPVVLRSTTGANASGRMLFGAGVDLNFVLAQGQAANLQLEPAGVAALTGVARFTAIDLTPIGEGIGPKRRLAPGQSRAFSFNLTDTRTIGVGVRASVDIATCRLLSADGSEIGRGLVLMHELKPGGYVLIVDAPSDGPAIDIEPALVGTVTPDKGPPDSVKADYLALVGKQARK